MMNVDDAPSRLLDAALDGAHHGYFGGLPDALLAGGRNSSIGRRMLMRRLLPHAPRVTLDLASVTGELIDAHPWALWNTQRLHDAAADLGALALVPGLRDCVEREKVLMVRAAIGSRRLAMVLQFNAGARVSGSGVARARKALAAALGNAEGVAALVSMRGYRELAGYAARIHPAFGERIRLVFRPEWRNDRADTWLPADVVVRYFAVASPQGVAAEAVVPAKACVAPAEAA